MFVGGVVAGSGDFDELGQFAGFAEAQFAQNLPAGSVVDGASDASAVG